MRKTTRFQKRAEKKAEKWFAENYADKTITITCGEFVTGLGILCAEAMTSGVESGVPAPILDAVGDFLGLFSAKATKYFFVNDKEDKNNE